LADDDGAGAQDKDGADVGAFGHWGAEGVRGRTAAGLWAPVGERAIVGAATGVALRLNSSGGGGGSQTGAGGTKARRAGGTKGGRRGGRRGRRGGGGGGGLGEAGSKRAPPEGPRHGWQGTNDATPPVASRGGTAIGGTIGVTCRRPDMLARPDQRSRSPHR